MSVLLIDDRGEIWDGQSRRLRQAFDSPYSGGEFSDYAVANLGFVALNVYGTSCQIRFRPSIIASDTYRALRDWLRQSCNERIVLTWYDQTWTSELLRAGPNGLKRLEQLIAGGALAKSTDFLSRLLTNAELNPSSPLGALIQNWASLSTPSGQHALMHLLQVTLGNRYAILKHDASSGRMIFHELGEGLFSDYNTWRSCAIGAPMEEQPDREYGRWVAAAYRQAFEKQMPMIAEVDAIVRWPHAGRVRMRYKRVIVPLTGASDAPKLLGGSLIENRIDLRVGLG